MIQQQGIHNASIDAVPDVTTRGAVPHALTSRLSQSKPHLFWREDGDEVLVYLTDFLLNHSLVGLLLQLLAGQPEHHVLLAELGPQELPEAAATRRALHHLFE